MYDTYGTTASDAAAAGVAGGILAFMGAFFLVFLAIAVFMIVCMWRIFTKAGKPGWAAIVPIYNLIVLMEIIDRPVWWVALYFVGMIPVIGYIAALLFTIVIGIDVAKSFGKSTGFGVLVGLLPIVGYPMLAFGDAQYVGGAGKQDPNPLSNLQAATAAPAQPAAPAEPQAPEAPEQK